MKKTVLASRFDLPFYFRLPSTGFFTWDPECGVAAIYPRQHTGELSFSKSCRFKNAERLLDSSCPPIDEPFEYKYWMTCNTKAYGEVPTLYIDTGSSGGFSELRAYSEVTVFIVILKGHNSLSDESKARTFRVLNHFIDVYRIITQDPHVYRIDEEFDTYLVDYSVGTIPQRYRHNSVADILRNIQDIKFPRQIGKGRELKLRLNTLEDLFPGKVLEQTQLNLFTQLVMKPYAVPLHYELIFTAQVELKRRNYHIAILEAEIAFEVYITNALLEASVALGIPKNQVLADMENPKKLGLLSQRLRKLDSVLEEYRRARGLAATTPFVNSTTYKEWKNRLYRLRNRIVHEGWRLATFDLAKRGIATCKAAIKELEDQLPGIANPIQIALGVNHLQNTAGRLKF